MATCLTDLPPNVLTEILSRLPITTLFASKCVCKTFLHLSSPHNPHFATIHAVNAPQILIFQCKDDIGVPMSLIAVDPEADVVSTDASLDNPKLGNHLYELPRGMGEEYRLVNSCNGLILSVGKEARICNPVTNEYIMVPRTDDERPISMWLGFCPGSKRYKVLKFIAPVMAKILEIGSDSWKCIDNTHPVYEHRWADSHAFLDGFMYWMNGFSHHAMDFFDFERERFGVIHLPRSEGILVDRISIGILQGCLCLGTVDPAGTKATVWVLKQGNQNNWNMAYAVDIPEYMKRRYTFLLKPLQMLLNLEILMQFGDDGELVCYNVKNKSLRYVALGDEEMHNYSNTSFHRVPTLHSLVVLTPSVVSLKDSLIVDDNAVRKIIGGWSRIHSIPTFESLSDYDWQLSSRDVDFDEYYSD